MTSSKTLLSTLFVISTVFSAAGFAEEQMDVDLSDSLNFEEFHKDKPDSFKLWEDKDNVKKTYEESSKPSQSDQPSATAPETSSAAETTSTESATKGKRYEIRELYSISGSDRTGYNPNTVVQALYLQMQGYCPKGWKKLDERSEPDGGDAFYMYYSFECL